MRDSHHKSNKWKWKWLWGLTIIPILGFVLFVVWYQAPPSPAEQLAAIEAVRAIPDQENAAVQYSRMIETSSELKFPPQIDVNDELATRRRPWLSSEYPEIAAWIKKNHGMIEELGEASKTQQCVFPLSEITDYTTRLGIQTVQAIREWSFLLMRAAYNDLAEGRKRDAFGKIEILNRISDHAGQQPVQIFHLTHIAIEALALHLKARFIVVGDADDQDLDYLERSGDDMRYRLDQHLEAILQIEALTDEQLLAKTPSWSRLWWRWQFTRLREQPLERVEELYLRMLSEQRANRILIALRRFKNKTGQWPDSLAEITISNSDIAMVDPHNNGPFTYYRRGSDFVLYSIGPNRKDERGLTENKGGDDWPIWPLRRSDLYKEWQEDNAVRNNEPTELVAPVGNRTPVYASRLGTL